MADEMNDRRDREGMLGRPATAEFPAVERPAIRRRPAPRALGSGSTSGSATPAPAAEPSASRERKSVEGDPELDRTIALSIGNVGQSIRKLFPSRVA